MKNPVLCELFELFSS